MVRSRSGAKASDGFRRAHRDDIAIRPALMSGGSESRRQSSQYESTLGPS